MATIISLKRRIQAARNVSKTTKAMQMISASKLKKAQNAAVSTRPYVKELDILTHNVVGKIDNARMIHPYIQSNSKTGKTLMIVLGPDKGLCGGLVANLLRKLYDYQKGDRETLFLSVGKKVESPVSRMSNDIVASFHFGTITPTFDIIYPIMKIIDEYYLAGKVDSVKILFTNFTSFFTQNPAITTLLPVSLPSEKTAEKSTALPYVFEPDPAEILPLLLRHHVEMLLYHAFLESFASEQASRMVTMQNATNNANDIIEDLLLEYNKTRQAKITSELLDITGAGIASV